MYHLLKIDRQKVLIAPRNSPPLCRACRPTPRRHSFMPRHDELAACAPCPAAAVLGWRHGVGRLRRAVKLPSRRGSARLTPVLAVLSAIQHVRYPPPGLDLRQSGGGESMRIPTEKAPQTRTTLSGCEGTDNWASAGRGTLGGKGVVRRATTHIVTEPTGSRGKPKTRSVARRRSRPSRRPLTGRPKPAGLDGHVRRARANASAPGGMQPVSPGGMTRAGGSPVTMSAAQPQSAREPQAGVQPCACRRSRRRGRARLATGAGQGAYGLALPIRRDGGRDLSDRMRDPTAPRAAVASATRARG